MLNLVAPFSAAALSCIIAAPALASPFAHGPGYMAQETAPLPAPEFAPAPAPGPAPVAQPVAPQPYYAPQPYTQPYPQPYPQPNGPQSQPYYGPQPMQPMAEAPAPRRRKGLMVGGWTMLGVSYVMTSLTGAIMADACKSTSPCKRIGYYMLIPVVGPFIGIGPAQLATGKIFLGITGAIQAAGLIMGIVGTAQFVSDGKDARFDAHGLRVGRNLRLNAGPTDRFGGAMLDLRYRF